MDDVSDISVVFFFRRVISNFVPGNRSWATDEEYDPILVEYVNSSNLPILHESRQEQLLPPDYNGKSRHHHRETVITL